MIMFLVRLSNRLFSIKLLLSTNIKVKFIAIGLRIGIKATFVSRLSLSYIPHLVVMTTTLDFPPASLLT